MKYYRHRIASRRRGIGVPVRFSSAGWHSSRPARVCQFALRETRETLQDTTETHEILFEMSEREMREFVIKLIDPALGPTRTSVDKQPMHFVDALALIAQAVINIDERVLPVHEGKEINTFERGGPIHLALVALCEYFYPRQQ